MKGVGICLCLDTWGWVRWMAGPRVEFGDFDKSYNFGKSYCHVWKQSITASTWFFIPIAFAGIRTRDRPLWMVLNYCSRPLGYDAHLSYTFTLCSFPWPTAALIFWKTLVHFGIKAFCSLNHFLCRFFPMNKNFFFFIPFMNDSIFGIFTAI